MKSIQKLNLLVNKLYFLYFKSIMEYSIGMTLSGQSTGQRFEDENYSEY